MYDKTTEYEKKVRPLMAYINNICQQEGIDMIAEFVLKKSGERNESKYIDHFKNGDGGHHIVSTQFLLQGQ